MRKHALLAGAFMVLLLNVVYGEGTVVTDAFYSEATGDVRELKVYLPEGYDEQDDLTRYPLVVFLHGGYVNQNSYPMLYDSLDELIWTGTGDVPEGRMGPVVVALPNGNAELYGGLTWWSDSEVNGDFERYVHTDLVAHMLEEYNVDPAPELRAIMGHSMGGYGALSIAMRNPELFRGVATFGGVIDLTTTINGITPWILQENGGSGPFDPEAGTWTEILFSLSAAFSPDPESPSLVDLPILDDGTRFGPTWLRWMAEDPAHIARDLVGHPQPEIHLFVGSSDLLWIDVNHALSDSLEALGVAHSLDELPGGHNDTLLEMFPMALLRFHELFAQAASSPKGESDLSAAMPGNMMMKPAWPNPFNGEGRLELFLRHGGNVSMTLHNSLGQAVGKEQGRVFAPGWHTMSIPSGSLAAGTYFVTLRHGAERRTQKVVIVR